jgi:hypothetical protein
VARGRHKHVRAGRGSNEAHGSGEHDCTVNLRKIASSGVVLHQRDQELIGGRVEEERGDVDRLGVKGVGTISRRPVAPCDAAR